MNCAYRLIWNEQLNAWVVAPEIASARGKRGQVRRCAAVLMLTLAIGAHAALAADLAATALPGGGQISAGQATISSTGAAMTINQGSQRAIINWQNFDIGSQASVNFQQPNSSAVTLNRAGGPAASRIEGQLTANGQVFLINPSGVLFGSGARVNVGGLVASTLNIRDADFLSGNYVFSGNGGSITNQGQITAAPGGYLAFISPSITNNGTISAPQGTVAMGAGERVRLNFAGDRLVGLDVSASTIDTLITNNQAIRAEGGAILLTAAGAEAVTRSVINNTGVLEASSLTQEGGRIVLTAGNDINLGAASTVAVDGQKGGEITVQAQAGTLLADGSIMARGAGGTGGSIQLLGKQVGLINAAQVDASGATGGGTVLVGGDYQGGNAAVQNAFRTYVGPQATITADAITSGDGGKVIVWADDVTRFYGKISATGGLLAGNGGFVEVSGKGYLDFNGVVNTTALNGNVGTLLLDPTNIEVITGGTATLAQVNQFTDPDLTASCAAFAGAACSRIAPTTINAAAANVVLQATNNILFTNAVNITTAGIGLTATAQTGNITVNAPITTANRTTTGTTGAVTLSAGGNVVLNADITTGNASVVDAAGNQTAASGNIGITTGTGISGAGRLITGTAALTGAAAGTENIRSGTITLNVIGAGAVGLSAANALTIGSATGNGTGSTATTGNIAFTSADRINNGTAGGAIDVSFGSASSGATNTAGSLTATTDGGAGASGEIVIASGEALRLGTINAAGGAITLDVSAASTAAGVISGTGTSLTKLGAGTLTLSGNNTYTGATNINAGTLALGNNDRIANASALTVASGATFDLGNFAETVGSLAGAGTVTKSGATARTLTVGGDNTSTTFSGVIQQTGAGALSLTKAGAGTLTLSGANTYTGATTISAGTLVADNNTALGTTAAGTTVSSSATLALQGGITVGAEALSLNGTGVGGNGALRNLSGNNTWGGTITLAGATEIQSDAGTLLLNAANSITGTNRALTVDGAGNAAISGTITTGTGTLTKNGAGTLTLSGANTYTGATTVSTGTLVVASNTALGTTAGGVTVASGATLGLQGGITVGAEALSLNGTGVGGNGALRNLSGNNTWGGTVTLAGAAEIQSDAGTLTLSAANSVTGATQNLTVDGAGNTTINGTITTSTGTLSKNGGGNLTLLGANTYTGLTTVSAGTVTASNATALGTTAGGTTVAVGATLNINNAAVGAEALTLNGTLRGTGAGASLAGTVALNATGATIDTATATDALTLSGVVSGVNALTKTGAGTLTLGGVNTYTGATNINAGTLALNAANRIADTSAVTVASGATFNLAGFAETVGSIAGAGNITLGAGTLTAGGDNTSTTFSGTASGTGGLTKAGTGTLTLSGANTYTGLTTVSAGTLTASNATALGAAAGGTTVAAGATLNINNVAIGAEPITLNGGGVGGVGALSGTGVASLTGAVNLGSASTIGTTSAASSLTLGGVVTAPLALTIAGPGSVTATNSGNNLSSVAINGAANVALRDANDITVNASTLNGTLSVVAAGTVTLGGVVSAGGSGDAIVLSGSRFLNTAGSGALATPNGRWLVWSSNLSPFSGATPDNRGGLVYDFKQYNTAYGGAILGAGNGFIYTLAPTITPGLTGTVSKVYDGTTTATLAAGNFTTAGAVDGDTVTLSGTGNYANRNVGTAKTVTATGISASSSNGAATVYGYQVNPTSASANIGTITAGPLTVTAQTDNRVYNGTTGSAVAPVLTGATYDGVGTAATQTYDNRNADTGKTLTASGLVMNDGNGGNNYAVSYIADNTGVITAAPLTVTAQTDNRVYNGTTSSAVAPALSGTTYDAVGTAATQTYDNRNVGTGKTLTASGLVMNDGNGGNNYAVSYVDNLTGQITQAVLTLNAASDTKVYDGTTSSSALVTASNLQTGDTFTASQSFLSKNVLGTNGSTLVVNGGYVINDGNGGNNYAVTTSTATGTITPFALTGSITANDKIYDGTSAATIASRSLTGVFSGDSVSYGGGTATFADKNAGTAKTVTATGLGLSGADAGNYTVNTTATTTANITSAALVITADDASKQVNTPNPQFTASYAGFVGGETPVVLNGVLSFSTPATLTSPVGIYPITPYGQSSGNYAIAYLDGDLTVYGAPVITPTLPREVVSQQAIGAQYTDPTMPSDVLTGLQFIFEDKHDATDEKVATSVVRVVGSGIRLPN